MNNQANRATFLAKNARLVTGDCPAVMTLKLPDAEEIARAIWQRQHDASRSRGDHLRSEMADPSCQISFGISFCWMHRLSLQFFKRNTLNIDERAKASKLACASSLNS